MQSLVFKSFPPVVKSQTYSNRNIHGFHCAVIGLSYIPQYAGLVNGANLLQHDGRCVLSSGYEDRHMSRKTTSFLLSGNCRYDSCLAELIAHVILNNQHRTDIPLLASLYRIEPCKVYFASAHIVKYIFRMYHVLFFSSK